MKINFQRFDQYELQIKEIRHELHLPPEVRVEIARDAVVGLNDLTRSLANLHPHKRSIAVLGSQPSPIRELVTGFIGEGFAVQTLPVSFMHSTSKDAETQLSQAWQTLKKDTLFVVGHAVEPFTGAVFPFDWVRREAVTKQIFSLIYYSPDALTRGVPMPLTAFEGMVLDPMWGDEGPLALVLKGDRCQGDPLIWGSTVFHSQNVSRMLKTLKFSSSSAAQGGDPKKAESLIKSFELKMASVIKASVLPTNCHRNFDRAVLLLSNIYGEAVQHDLSAQGFEIYTSSSCAWEDPRLNPWLVNLGFTARQVQGSLIVPLSTLEKTGFEQAFTTSVQKIASLATS